MWETDWVLWPAWFGVFIERRADWHISIGLGPLLIARYKTKEAT